MSKDRDVVMNKSDFKSSLPQHGRDEKYKNFVSHYKLEYTNPSQKKGGIDQLDVIAGNYNQNPEEVVKISTTMVGEYKKEQADEKEQTKVQRSWLPPKDKSLLFGVGKSAS